MPTPTVRLIDILSPPVNQWLSDLTRRKTNLPAGVRVVRFGEGDDEGAERQEEMADTSMSAG